MIEAVKWSPQGDAVRIIDQTLLPERYEELDLRTLDDVCEAIARLAVRGAPAIGVAGAMGLVTSLLSHVSENPARFRARLGEHAQRIRRARPTGVNLGAAIDRMLRVPGSGLRAQHPEPRTLNPGLSNAVLLEALRGEATAILEEDRRMCHRIGEHGLPLIPDGAQVLTHCNAGALATAGMGTALAPLYLAAREGRKLHVIVDETRPLLQGSRLTAWELGRAGIPVTVVADSVPASLMRAARIDLVIVGADRIAANGDVANKIGTYGIAIAARYHGIPFYVAAPTSTFDAALDNGDEIVIEERGRDEIAHAFGKSMVPESAAVNNPAFDITPATLVTAIISDRDVHRAPYDFRMLGGRTG